MSHSTRRSFRPALLTTALVALVATAATFALTGAGAPAPAPASGQHAVLGEGAPAADLSQSGADRGATETTRGCWTAPVGSRFVHHVVDRCDFVIQSAEGGTQPAGALHTDCDVETTVLDRRNGELLVRQQIHGLRFLGADGSAIADDPVQASLVAATEAPVLVRLGPVGQILAYGFARALDGDQRNFLRGTLGLLGFEAPPADAKAWTSQVVDTTGEFDARYDLLPAANEDEVAVRRTRVRYTAVTGHAEVPKHELRGAAEGHFALTLGWLQSAQVDEGMTMALPMLDLQAITARRAQITLTENGTTAIDLDVAAAWAAADAPATGRGEAIGGYAAGSERRRWAERLKGVTLEQLIVDLQKLVAADPVDAEALDGAFQQLQWLIKLDDRQAEVLAQQLTTRQLSEGVARVALGALGAAGTPAAQEALVAVRGDASVDGAVREAATIACIQLDDPTPAIVDGLVRDAGAASPMQAQSMLVLGALAPKAKNALADGGSPVQKLVAMENDAVARGDTATWLLAIGNAAPAGTLEIVQRHLTSSEGAVRSAACVALRRVADAQALPILVDRATTDTDAMVRRDAMLELGRRNAPAARNALQYVAQHDSDEELRNKAKKLLGGGA